MLLSKIQSVLDEGNNIMTTQTDRVCIRIASQKDFDLIRNIVQNTIMEVYPHYYPRGVVEFFSSLHNDIAIKEDIETQKVYIVMVDQTSIATVTIDKNEINRLFVFLDYQKHGYGTQILDWAENKIFKMYGTVRLHAALPGKSIYLKRGYKLVEFRKKEVDFQDWICIDILEKIRE